MGRLEKQKRQSINEANKRLLGEEEEMVEYIDISKDGLEPLSHLKTESDGVPNAIMENGIIKFNYNNKKYVINLESVKNINHFKNLGTGDLFIGNNSEAFEGDDYNMYLMYRYDGLVNPDNEISKMMNNNDDLFLQLYRNSEDDSVLCFKNKNGQFEILQFIVTNKTTNESLKVNIKKIRTSKDPR